MKTLKPNHTYTYEPDGLRRSAFHAGMSDVVTFIWDGDDLLNERIEGVHAARYAVLDGEVLSEKRGASRYRFVPDPLGSVRALLDASGTIVATRDYWPYGEVAAESSGMTSLQFVGILGYFTDATGRIYVRARHYRADMGRWVTVDPIGFAGGDWSLYGYCRGGPCSSSDPSGLRVYVCTVYGPPAGIQHEFISTNLCGAVGFYGGALPQRGVCQRDEQHLMCPDPPRFPDDYVIVGWREGPRGRHPIYELRCFPGRGNPGVICRPMPLSEADERRLCECMLRSCRDPGFYAIPLRCCSDWVSEMLACAGCHLSPPSGRPLPCV